MTRGIETGFMTGLGFTGLRELSKASWVPLLLVLGLDLKSAELGTEKIGTK